MSAVHPVFENILQSISGSVPRPAVQPSPRAVPGSYVAVLDTTVDGIPCLVGVTDYVDVPGSYSRSAGSDADYYGFTERAWVILDRRGRRAEWLQRKLDAAGVRRIEQLIDAAMLETSQ